MDRPILVNEFDELGLSISDDLIDECVIVCHQHQISAADFVGSWIALCASTQNDANELNKENLAKLVKTFNKRDVFITDNKKSDKKNSNLNNSVSLKSVNSPITLNNTNVTNNINIENEISVSDIIDGDIKEENLPSIAGDVACNFGRENINQNDSSADVEISLLKQELWNNFIFGQVNYQKYYDHVQKIVDNIVEQNNLKPITPLPELISGNEDVEVIISGSLKLVKKELFLCSSYGYIKLDVSEAEQPVKFLFANQIVVVVGTKPDIKIFKVRKLYSDASLSLPEKLPDFSQGNLNLLVAAGPFFNESSPHGILLKTLVQKAIELEAKLVILFGPIFEADFGTQLNKTSSENLQKCYDDVLEAILKPLFNNPSTQNTKLMIYNSWKDATSYGFYPTPPNIESKLPALYPDNILMVSDPCVFSANGIVIAGNSSDSLMGLHVSAINQTHEEMFVKLAKQIIWQQCLHPSYTANPTVPVDQLLWLEHCTLQQIIPHIILTSSQLRTFIRVVGDCMVINVGQLVKYSSQKQTVSGTYGKIQIAPPANGIWSPKTNILAEVVYI